MDAGLSKVGYEKPDSCRCLGQADASIGCNLGGGVRARIITRCHLKGTADTKRLKFSSVVFRGRVFAISTLADAYDLGDIEKFINAILTMLRRKKT
ncbi:hypothetical protein AGR1A_pAt20140 [Agrobacterium fabacearum CFBP 5771]|nr:hypothetical protein AGR1A_pAt20140 [Agrobacterium fabacearum CFBP 5771]